MKTYRHTHYLKQMFRNPNIVPLCNIYIILMFSLMVFSSGGHSRCYVRLPDSLTAHWQPKAGQLVTIWIKKDETICCCGTPIEINELADWIMDIAEETKSDYDKILLKVDRRTRFGRVQEVLRAVKKADFHVAGLITMEYAAPIDLFNCALFNKPKKQRHQ
ncbi:MAG: hypothetical protein GY757_00475 [bacterium]|nr:hypothetical protein [bacterium]